MVPADVAWVALSAALGAAGLAVLYVRVRPTVISREAAGPASPARLFGLYLLVAGSGHLAWEVMQLPFYALWRTETAGEIAFAVVHCTLGDLLIATAALAVAWLVLRPDVRSPRGYLAAAALAIVLGVAYTAFSEWHNVYIVRAWAYAPQMPTIEISGHTLGLTPLAQWLAVPAVTFYTLRPRPA